MHDATTVTYDGRTNNCDGINGALKPIKFSIRYIEISLALGYYNKWPK